MVMCYTCDINTDDYVVTDGMFLCRECEDKGFKASGLLMLIFLIPVIIMVVILFIIN